MLLHLTSQSGCPRRCPSLPAEGLPQRGDLRRLGLLGSDLCPCLAVQTIHRCVFLLQAQKDRTFRFHMDSPWVHPLLRTDSAPSVLRLAHRSRPVALGRKDVQSGTFDVGSPVRHGTGAVCHGVRRAFEQRGMGRGREEWRRMGGIVLNR